MLRIGQLKLPPNHTESELHQKILKTLHISNHELLSYQIRKLSIDARKKPDIKYVYTIDVNLTHEQKVLKKSKGIQLSIVSDVIYRFPQTGTENPEYQPVIIGAGPAGLFAAYMLAQNGYKPIVFERGKSVDERVKDIETFWETGILNAESNVQFGEGGAGTFSDGKLNTLVKDVSGRNRKVLEIFVENGAPEEILYVNKPHIGTDLLIHIIRNMRQRIILWGGTFHFESKFEDFTLKNGKLESITIRTGENLDVYKTNTLILAIGHSARDTFSMLYEKKIPIHAKAFAVGVRVEHLQQTINDSQYGKDVLYQLPPAAYKVTANLENGRGVYSFCMCPGGYVVNASSETGHLAVNGMSYHARDGQNANSAIIVTVTPDDFGSEHPLAGMYFQRQLEKKAFEIGKGKVPVQRFEDFCKRQTSTEFGNIKPQIKGEYHYADLNDIFPDTINESLKEGIFSFEHMIPGFSDADAILSGVESRTSSPIRIERNEYLQIDKTGIFPCGEGAGYAGGITSAAMDGLKTAEMIAQIYAPFDSK